MATYAGLNIVCSSHFSASFPVQKFYNLSPWTTLPPITSTKKVATLACQANDNQRSFIEPEKLMASNLDFKNVATGERFREVHSIEEYHKGIELSEGSELVIAHFSAGHSKHITKIQQFMKEQRREHRVKFLNVMADESEKTRQLCWRQNIKRIPRFIFYKNAEKIHEEAGFQPEKLARNVLYYEDDPSSPVVQLHCGEGLKKLIVSHRRDDNLTAINVVMKQCAPCAKIYPSVLKLASQMAPRVVFARMHADGNDSCMQILRDLDVSKVPAFFFFRNGELCGKYVGSNASALIREISKMRTNDRPYRKISKL